MSEPLQKNDRIIIKGADDFNGEKGIICDFKKNMFGDTLVVVRRDKSINGRTNVFYINELEKEKCT